MSFVADGKEQESMKMTCYYAPELAEMIQEAAKQENCQISGIEFFDRSIMAGRHTSTLEYNSDIPPYREVINSLYETDRTTDFQELLFQCPLPDAPYPVTSFFERFSQMWNKLIIQASEFCGENLDVQNDIKLPESVTGMKQELSEIRENHPELSFRANFVEPTLANYLYRLESSSQPGLGVGHTLIAIAYVDGEN